MKTLWLWIGLVALLVSGCAPGGTPELGPTQVLVPSTATPSPARMPSPSAAVTALPGPDDVMMTDAASPVPAQAQVIGAVLADLAERLAVDTRDIDVAAAEAVAWTTLACDAEVAPVTTLDRVAGFHVVLAHAGQHYSYRAAADGAFILCEDDDLAVAGDPVLLDTNLSALVELAMQDLAQRLDLPQRRVFLVEAYPITWPDGSIGCALSDEVYPPTPVAGYRIVLRVGSEAYNYHANYRQAILCPAGAVRLPTVVAATSEGGPGD